MMRLMSEIEPPGERNIKRRLIEDAAVGSVSFMLGAISVAVYDKLRETRREQSVFDEPVTEEDPSDSS
jgi:hypothetical protein